MNRLLTPARPTLVDPMRSPYPIAAAAVAIVAGTLMLALTAQLEVDLRVGPVPITGQTFGVLLIGAAYGSRLGVATLTAYVAEGWAGMPVFAGGAHGWSALSGPSGGYIFGFVAAAFVVGLLVERGWGRSVYTTALAMLVGNIVIYAFGVARLQDFVGWENVWKFGVRDFLPGDAIKILLASGVMPGAWWLRRYLGGLAARGDPR